MASQGRITSILEAHGSNASNRLSEVMKVLTVLTGMFGMHVEFPGFLGGPKAQLWWSVGAMLAIGGSMLWRFRKRDWL